MIIKKKVSLGFLGEEYKDAYLTFKSIPVIEFEEIQNKLKALEGGKDAAAIKYILELLKSHYLSGEFPDDSGKLEDVKKEDLDQLDSQTLLECFKTFTGQDLDPKAPAVEPTPSSTPSTTEQAQEN